MEVFYAITLFNTFPGEGKCPPPLPKRVGAHVQRYLLTAMRGLRLAVLGNWEKKLPYFMGTGTIENVPETPTP